MSANLLIALQITAIGMSLVFAGILVLWLVMALLMRFFPDHASQPLQVSSPPENLSDLKRRAAALAVAVARARQLQTPAPLPTWPVPSTAAVSPWQAVMRGKQLKQRGPVR